MTRPISERMARAMMQGAPACLFVKIDHPSGTGYFCTGIGSRDWDGHTWSPVGVLGSVTPVKQTTDFAIQNIVFRLSGVDPTIVGTLADDVQNHIGEMWFACLDWRGNVVPDPYKLTSAELDYQTLQFDLDGSATIEITAHDGMYVLDRAVDEAWSSENQKLLFPDDTGLDMIPSLVHQDLQWTAT